MWSRTVAARLSLCDYRRTLYIQIVEDELDVLLVLSLYTELIHALFPDAWLTRSICDELFYRIMQTKDDKHIYLFIYSAFKHRQTHNVT